jgi:CheY-like chemotaxis protein
MATKEAKNKILVLDNNPDVRKHLGGLLDKLGRKAPVSVIMPETAAADQETALDAKKLHELLGTEKLSAILLAGELGLHLRDEMLGLGDKRGDDGQIIAARLRNGHYGALNRETPIFGIFGDYRINGAVGVVLNACFLDAKKSGIADVLEYLEQQRLLNHPRNNKHLLRSSEPAYLLARAGA